METLNNPYAQGYVDCLCQKPYHPNYYIGFPDCPLQYVDRDQMSNYDRGQYTLGWDTCIKEREIE